MASGRRDPPVVLSRAEVARRRTRSTLDDERRSALGQFMTPAPIAAFMASMFELRQDRIRLLDAGAGVGSLTAALVAEACRRKKAPAAIDATAFEVDELVLDQLRSNLVACGNDARTAGIAFNATTEPRDFIDAATAWLDSGLFVAGGAPRFNAAILNPPYRKLGAQSIERHALRSAGIETSNLYAAFVALAIKLLEPKGELVAITPRSFCNGPYFRAFRKLLMQEMTLVRIHVFDSRRQAFQDDGVLQENVIVHARKGSRRGRVVISASEGPGAPLRRRKVLHNEVVDPSDPRAFIHIATSEHDTTVTRRIAALPCTLDDLDIQVSTGRVVDFRARKFLRMEPEARSVPLIYPSHFLDGFVSWPRDGGRKPNALADERQTRELMVANETYVLTKRFTSKEEPRRLVAVVYDPARLSAKVDRVGFENHVNYFHTGGRGLQSFVARGLAGFLNTSLADRYFRQFNGHTQVNASDLRSFRYPSLAQLRGIGRQIGASFPAQGDLDEIVDGALPSAPKDSAR